jgi:sarcosine oxidase gamma subunit
MLTEQPPFRNVAIMADNDRMYHHIGRVGAPNAPLAQMTAAAELRAVGGDTWAIVENGEVRATYPFLPRLKS